MMNDDPIAPAQFGALMAQMGVPTPDPWRLAPIERKWALGRVHRRLLVQTVAGWRRLRTWIQAQRGQLIVVESRAARARRVREALPLFGDEDLLPVIAQVVADLPRCVSDVALAEVAFVVTGRTTAGWCAGPLPPGRRVIVLDGSRDDAAVASTVRHEIGHAWLVDQSAAPTVMQQAVAETQWRDRIASLSDPAAAARYADAVIGIHERQANALRVAWENLPLMPRRY